MADNQITAVLFDWDFTLAYSIGPNVTFSERLAVLFRRYGVQTTADEMDNILNTIRREISTGVLQASLFPQEKQAIIKNYRIILGKLGHPDTSYDFAYQLYSSYAELPHFLYDDVLPTMQALKQCGYRLGILSNHSVSARTVMEKMIGEFIPTHHITVSEALDMHKPDPNIFWVAAAKLGAQPAACFYVGDNLEVDAIGAVQQGGYAQGLWLNREKRPFAIPLPQHVAQIESLTQMLKFLP